MDTTFEEREYLILFRHFAQHKSYADIAEELGISKTRARQLLAKAVEKLRQISENFVGRNRQR